MSGILDEGEGILRLTPTWVPRDFCRPGRRLKLDPRDYYALGTLRGGITERWLASTAAADNGPLTGANEGLSVVAGTTILLAEFVEELGADLIGSRHATAGAGWAAFAKLFDTAGPIPFHFHLTQHHAELIGKTPKPEAYYFPPQLNGHLGETPYSYLGLQPGTTKDSVAQLLARFGDGDNEITRLSQAYRIIPGTGWDIPPGVLHAPGSACTYEPQGASDVSVMCECLVDERPLRDSQLWRDVVPERHGDVEAIIEMLDWEANTDPNFAQRRFMVPLPTGKAFVGAIEEWIAYRSADFSATRVEVDPGASVTITDSAAYGVLCVQGRGRLGGHAIESPSLIRFGAPTEDEFFVSEAAAVSGVVVSNESATEPLVLLKQFGPGNPDLRVDPLMRIDALGAMI
jgi:hypothetical protein